MGTHTILYRIILEVLEILNGIFWKFWIFFIECFQKSWKISGILLTILQKSFKTSSCFFKRWWWMPCFLFMFFRLVTYETILYRIILEVLEILEEFFESSEYSLWNGFKSPETSVVYFWQFCRILSQLLPVSSKDGVECLVCLFSFSD